MDSSPHSLPARRDDAPSLHVDGLTRALGALMLVGVAMITVICLLVQFLRTDLNWITDEMSIYVLGPYGAWVQAGFIAPVPGIVALGVGWYRGLDRSARSVIPLPLFTIAAIALCLTAINHPDTTDWPFTMHGRIHQWAAFATFVCVTTGMLVQSWHIGRDPRWRPHYLEAMVLASVTAAYFWVYALLKPIPRGIGEKVVIALVLLWLWRTGWWLVRGRAPG